MKNQNSNSESYTIEDILIFSLKKIYSGRMVSNSKDNNCLSNINSFNRYFEFLSKEAEKYISNHLFIGCSLIPYILAKDLELYFNDEQDYDFYENLKYELANIVHKTHCDAAGTILCMFPTVTELQDNGNTFAEKPESFKCVIRFMTELFKINLSYLDPYKLYETFVRKTKIRSFGELSSSYRSIKLLGEYLDLLKISILPRIDSYRVLLTCIAASAKSPRFEAKLSLASLFCMLKICKKLLREYNENATKINKDLRLIYGILVFSMFSCYIGIIFQCLHDMICSSKEYKIRDEHMEKIIKISVTILNDCYRTMFIEENKIWPEISNCKYIYLKFCRMWEFPVSESWNFYRKYLSERNECDKRRSLEYLKDIAGVANIMKEALRLI